VTDRPTVAVVFTGGTISMRHDDAAGGTVPSLDGQAILARTPGLEGLATIVAIDRGLTPASHFTIDDLIDIAAAIGAAAARPDVHGVVVVQGTDSIEESAFAWDLLLDVDEPVVVTGAMRASHAQDYDGPDNLRAAVACAASPALRGHGVVVALSGTIEPADDVQKSHASALDTFRSPNTGRLGTVVADVVALERQRGSRRHCATERATGPVDLITVTTGMDGRLIDAAVASGCRGIVVAATGAGNTSPATLTAAERAMAAGIPVVLTTRCPAGRAQPEYAFPGGGATWAAAGAILAGHLTGPKARIALALGLGAGLDTAGLEALLADPGA
jgi:L-asparaginase